MEHSYVKNWELPPMLLLSKKSFPNFWTLGSTTAIKKAVTWGRGDQEGWDSLKSQWWSYDSLFRFQENFLKWEREMK